MAALVLPSSPSVNDVWSPDGSFSCQWDGTTWRAINWPAPQGNEPRRRNVNGRTWYFNSTTGLWTALALDTNIANVTGLWQFDPTGLSTTGNDGDFFFNHGTSSAKLALCSNTGNSGVGGFASGVRTEGMSHSLRVNDSDTELIATASGDWVPASGTITYEIRCRIASAVTSNILDLRQQGTVGNPVFYCYSDGRLAMAGVSGSELMVSSAGVFQFNTEAFVSVTRDASNIWRLHYQGVQVASSSADSTNYNDANARVWVMMGAYVNVWTPGWVHEVRITKGTGRYSSSSYTPPVLFSAY